MRWSETNYPKELEKIKPELRKKAIDLANSLMVSKKFQESNAINTALHLVKDWERSWGKAAQANIKNNSDNTGHPSINPGLTGSFYNNFRKSLYIAQQGREAEKEKKNKAANKKD